MMRFTSILLCCSFLCLTLSVQCYGGYEPLLDFLRAQKRKKGSTLNSVDENVIISNYEYSPVYIGNQYCLKEADKIVSLPGQPQVDFDQYSGYVTVDPDAGRALFYYFTESEDPSNKPLVLWLNGGPACSSLGAGAMTELGPFRVNPDGETLWYNDYAWNKEANVIFLESPAGVGFSYSNRTSDYTTGDQKTALDAYTFLVNWLERFPEYKNRDFYITGESYAGHYVPQLASLILQYNKNTNQTTTVINLKGIAIGNALIDNEDAYRGTFDYHWTHALISDEIYQGIIDNCDFTSETTPQTNCQDFVLELYNMTRDIWVFDIYAPLCTYPPSNSPSISGFDPCTDNYTYAYLNTPQVQEALHANITRQLPGPWELCNVTMHKNWTDSPSTVLPTIMELMASGIRVWIYSGDTDRAIPVTATRYSFVKLNAPVKTPWYPWYTQDEVGGYAVEYENVTFATVRGSGHFVPSYQPQRALTLFSSFLAGKLPPRKKDD